MFAASVRTIHSLEITMTKSRNLWGGRFSQEADPSFTTFNNSFAFDRRLFAVDIQASVAHCNGLAAAGVITREEADRINAGLQSVLAHEDDSAYFDQTERSY